MGYKKCARARHPRYPYWCTRILDHTGPCALRRRWFYWLMEK